MDQSIEDIADRIIICGLREMQTQLETEEIGVVVTACKSRELREFNLPSNKHYRNDKDSGPEIIKRIHGMGANHYQSYLYEFLYESANNALKMQDSDFDRLSEQELDNKMQAFFLEQAQSTINIIDDFFQNEESKKIMIHCAEGSDRSASIAAIYLLKKHGTSIDKALRLIQEIRPGAQLDIPTEVLKSFLGDQYECFAKNSNALQKNCLIKFNGNAHEFKR